MARWHLAIVEEIFGLPELGAVATAASLMDLFDP